MGLGAYLPGYGERRISDCPGIVGCLMMLYLREEKQEYI